MIENNGTCSYPRFFKWMMDVTYCSSISIFISVLAFVSNMFTVLILRRVKMRSSTENLLLAIATTDLLLPLIHSARYLVVFFRRTAHEVLIFETWHFFPWQYFYLTSILFALVLAARRYIAIEYAYMYQSVCSRRNTKRMIYAVFICSAMLILPLMFNVPDYGEGIGKAQWHCSMDVPEEVIYYSIIVFTIYLKGDYRIRITYWLYICVFQLLSPFILAALSFRFARAFSKRMTSKQHVFNQKLQVQANQKTKLIFIVSLLVLIRDLPLGLFATFYIFVSPSPEYLATIRLLTRELTIVMSAANFVVLYFTNQRFKEAVPRPRFPCSRKRVDQRHEHNLE